jgi:hypothetical protein
MAFAKSHAFKRWMVSFLHPSVPARNGLGLSGFGMVTNLIFANDQAAAFRPWTIHWEWIERFTASAFADNSGSFSLRFAYAQVSSFR